MSLSGVSGMHVYVYETRESDYLVCGDGVYHSVQRREAFVDVRESLEYVSKQC